ncbi:hypothetical protein [Marinobacter sp. C2H3]|uniref:hypothetical protein n=1 Tax=Marinobacter sp. C2H3 TaxID=3119003 RepID=UPI00300EF471
MTAPLASTTADLVANSLEVASLLGLAGLVLLLGVKVKALARTEPLMDAMPDSRSGGFPAPAEDVFAPVMPSERPRANHLELVTQLHILAGLQDRDCREQALPLAQSPGQVRVYAGIWLYGAANALCERSARHSPQLAALAAQIAGRKWEAPHTDLLWAIRNLTSDSVYLTCFRAGLEGASHWQGHHFVPAPASVYQAVTSNAFI